MTTPKRLSAGLLATAVAAGGAVMALGFPSHSADDELPPPPPLLEMSAPEPIVPADGLDRLIVTVPSTPTDSSSTEPGVGGAVDGQGSVSDTEPDGLLDALPDEAARIVVRDGRLGYLDVDGEFTAFDGADGEAEHGSTTADTLAGLPGVESVEPISDSSFAVRTSEPERLQELTDLGVTVTEEMFLALTGDPYEPYQWSLDNTGSNLSGISSLPNVEQTPDADLDGVEARLDATGRGAVVAIIDSGVDFSHPELAHAAWVNPGEDCDSEEGNGIDDDGNGYIDDCSGWDFGDHDRQMFDGSNNAHGTHVAGIVAARSGNGQGVAGVAPDAMIMDLKVSDSWGAIPSSSIAMAIRYAVDNGADVVNLSLGSEPGAPPASAAEMASAADYARVNGVLLVVAAGNNGVSLDSAPVYPASLDTSNMIVVGATDPTDHRASFSNFGSTLDLFAPGLHILSTTPGGQLAFQSGTSQASPAVAGAAALAIESLGTSNPSAIIDRLTASADSLPNLHGQAANPLRVNAARAVGVAVGAAGTPDGAGDSGGSAGSIGSITVRGLAGDETGQVTASIAIAVEDEALDQPFQWEASLFALQGGRVFAIPDHEVTAGPTGDSQPAMTDERGAVPLATDTTRSAVWDTVLPGGTYALLIEAVPENDPDMRLGDGFLATFVVAGASADDGGSGDGSSSGSDDGSSGDSTDGGSGSDSDGSGGDGPPAGSGGDGSSTGGSSGGSTGDSTTGGSTGGSAGDSPAGSTGGGADPGSGDGPGPADGGSTGGSSGSTPAGSAGGGTGPGSGDGPGSAGGGSTGGSPGGPVGGSTGGTTEPSIGSGSNGDWAVVDISPQVGFVDTLNVVYVFGSFAEPVTVWFGNSAARTVSQTESLLIVQTERRAQPGVVDVSLRRQSQEVLRLPQAYSFVTPDGGSGGGGGPGPDPGDGATGSGGGSTGDTGGSSGGAGSGGSADEDPGTDGGTGGDVPTDDGSGGEGSGGDAFDDGSSDGGAVTGPRGPVPRASLNGDPIHLSNGLIGVPVRGVHVVGPFPSCGIDPCRARRI